MSKNCWVAGPLPNSCRHIVHYVENLETYKPMYTTLDQDSLKDTKKMYLEFGCIMICPTKVELIGNYELACLSTTDCDRLADYPALDQLVRSNGFYFLPRKAIQKMSQNAAYSRQ